MSPDSEITATFSYNDLFRLIKKSLILLVFFCFFVMIIVGLITYFFIPKRYQCSALFYIDTNSVQRDSLVLNPNFAFAIRPNWQSQLCSEIILARQFLTDVLKAEGFSKNASNIIRLQKAVGIERRDSGAIKIQVEWTDPKSAYRLTRRILEQFQEMMEKEVNFFNSSTRRFVEQELSKSKTDLDLIEQKILFFQKQNGVSVSEQAQENMKLLMTYEQQKAEVESDLAETRRRLQETEQVLNNQAPKLQPAIKELLNPILERYRNQLMNVEVELAKARYQYTDQSPTVKNLLAERQVLNEMLAKDTGAIRTSEIAAGYVKELIAQAGLETKYAVVTSIYEKHRQQIDCLPDKLLTYTQLLREQKVAEQRYLLLINQLDQVNIAEYKEENIRIKVIDAPVIPEQKSAPSTMGFMIMAGVTTFFIGMGVILLREGFSRLRSI